LWTLFIQLSFFLTIYTGFINRTIRLIDSIYWPTCINWGYLRQPE